MFVLEKCYTGCGWAAYAYINSWMSVYQVRSRVALACSTEAAVSHPNRTAIRNGRAIIINTSAFRFTSLVRNHAALSYSAEVILLTTRLPQNMTGHSYGMAHSGGLDGQTYTDHTCLMGNPLYSDSVAKMCFNPAKK